MTGIATVPLALAVAVLTLAGCARLDNARTRVTDGLTNRLGGGDDIPAEQALTVPGAPGEVEAPEIYSLTETGLWDGRPSLGGIWVAHPDVDEPQKVVIRTAAGDASVVGALFRREREIPGPRLQVSSDAAEALGLLAGQPVTLEVVALRSVDPTDRGDTVDQPAVADGAGAAPGDTAATDPLLFFRDPRNGATKAPFGASLIQAQIPLSGVAADPSTN